MAGYPGGEQHGKRTLHVLYHEHTGKVIGHAANAEDGLIDKHEHPTHERAQPNAKPAHYSDDDSKADLKAAAAASAIKPPPSGQDTRFEKNAIRTQRVVEDIEQRMGHGGPR